MASYLDRLIEDSLRHHLNRKKSILLLGPRQTGKTTLLNQFAADITISFLLPTVRQTYERNPEILIGEIAALDKENPLIVLDEVQRCSQIMDVVQFLIDEDKAQFILTGSSARKLRRGSDINLLPGRVVGLRLDPFTIEELKTPKLEEILFYGSLPGIEQNSDNVDKEVDLQTYVETYLEEEVRAEVLVRDLGSFSRFLELASLESGKIVNFSSQSRQVGVTRNTIASYYEILVDCLVAERVEPISASASRSRLTKTSRYLIFDLGVRRLAAREGTRVTPERKGELFEHFIGLELIRKSRMISPKPKIRFWRDPSGPEVDWVIDVNGKFIPIETKWTSEPQKRDVRHLHVFLNEYDNADHGYLVCRCERKIKMANNITALPWQELTNTFEFGSQS